jgi:hypothetical protein
MYVHCIGRNDSLRIAYIHVVKKGKDGKQSEYYSKLVKADPSGNDQVLFSLITTSLITISALCYQGFTTCFYGNMGFNCSDFFLFPPVLADLLEPTN